jgi:hypothetical protein
MKNIKYNSKKRRERYLKNIDNSRQYYQKNKEKKKEYQNKYYEDTKYNYLRKMELKKHESPDEYWAFKNRISERNKEYYKNNRDKILLKRSQSRNN